MRYLIIIFIFASLSLAGQVTPAQIKKANLIFLERDYLRQVLEEKQRVIDLQDDIIIHTSDDKYYYSEKNWRKFENKFNRVYLMLIVIPAVLLMVFLLIQAFSRFF